MTYFRFSKMALASRIAIVTGAASGLGKATALRLARAGARVAILDLPSQPGAELAKSIGASAAWIPTDVTSEDQVRLQSSLACVVRLLLVINACSQPFL